MIKEQIKRLVLRLFPELQGGLHLPQWGKVVKIHPIVSQGNSTESEPLYCVDVQMLDHQGKPDDKVPVFEMLALPTNMAGAQRGLFGFPEEGALVELGFIMGLPSRPFIRTVLTQEQQMPQLAANDVVLARNSSNYYRMNENNNLVEQCQGVAERVAKIKQRLLVSEGTMWLGNQNHNALKILVDLHQEVIKLASMVASHSHSGVKSGTSSTSTPSSASSATTVATNTTTLKTNLESFTES